MSEFTFSGLGGVSEVGASCYLYTFGETRLLVDAGTRPNALGEASLPDLDALEQAPDAVLLTHAHSDHIGALPLFKKRFPRVPVYTTHATARIALNMLTDAVRVQASQGAPLYSLRDVTRALKDVTFLEPFEQARIADLKVTPYPAGHLLGAVSFLMESEVGTVFHTGDVSNTSSYLTDAAYMPESPVSCDVVVCESTYGDTVSHVSRKAEIRRFAQAVGETLKRGGRALVPAFALGRSTEVALTLADHMRGGLVPKVPIVLDGLVRSVHEAIAEDLFTYLPAALQNRAKNSASNPLYPETLLSVETSWQRERLIRSDEPMVVIASSGMLSAGVSPLYAKPLVQSEANLLAFVGYQDEGAVGKRFLELTERGAEVKLPTGPENSFEPVPVHCRVEAFSFSGHADAGGLVSLVKRYDPKRVVLVHGDGSARHALAGLLKRTAHIDWPQNGEHLDLGTPTYKEHLEVARAQSETKKRSTKITRFNTTAQAVVEGSRLVLEFDDSLDAQHLMGGVEQFKVEIVRGDSLKVKLREKLAPAEETDEKRDA